LWRTGIGTETGHTKDHRIGQFAGFLTLNDPLQAKNLSHRAFAKSLEE
jgi:hypothetical protein